MYLRIMHRCCGLESMSVQIDFISISTLTSIVMALIMPIVSIENSQLKLLLHFVYICIVMAMVQMLKRFKGLCLILFVILQDIGNVGTEVWLPKRWPEGQQRMNIHSYRLFPTCMRHIILVLAILS